MAVTTSYALSFVQNLDLTYGETQSDAVGLADGGFAAIATHTGAHIDGQSFRPDTGGAASFTNITGTDGAIDQLANGNLVIVSQDGDSILFKVVDPNTSNTVVSTTDLGDTNSSNADVAGLTGGRFVIVDQDAFTAPDHDIDVTIRNSDGTAVTSLTIEATNADDENASVAALDNGNFAVAWQRNVSGASQLWYAVYDANGAVVKGPALFDSAGSVNANPSVVATTGGFAIAYEDNGWDGDTDVTLAQFNNAGTFQRFDNVAADTVADTKPYLVSLANGMFVVSYAAAFGDNDITTNLISASGTILATRTGTAGESLFDEQISPSLAALSLGRIASFWVNSTDNDIDGELTEAIRTSIGDTAADTVVGDFFKDHISGNDGADTLTGGANADQVHGGTGSDSLRVNAGDTMAGEIYDGGADSDTMVLFGDGMSVFDFAGSDVIDIEILQFSNAAGGGASANFVADQFPFSAIFYDAPSNGVRSVNIAMNTATTLNLGAVFLSGAAAGDTFHVTGDTAAETIVGSSIADLIESGDGSDTISGGDGSDTLDGGLGADSMDGGLGDDTYQVSQKTDGVSEAVGGVSGGVDTVFSAASTITLGANIEDLTLTGTKNSQGIGNTLGNRLTGNTGNNNLQGLNGDDTLTGGDGADELRGGSGVDRMNGGLGNDRYFVDDPGDQTIETNANPATGGIDTVFTTVNRTLGANIENLRIQGGNPINGTGNELGNKIFGNAGANLLRGLLGNDTIEGRDGADTIDGGEGNDTLSGGSQADVFRFATANAGVDRILDFSKNFDRFDLSGGTFTAVTTAANGDAVLTHTGGAIRIASPPTLTLAQWNALVLPSDGRVANLAAPDGGVAHIELAGHSDHLASFHHGDWAFA